MALTIGTPVLFTFTGVHYWIASFIPLTVPGNSVLRVTPAVVVLQVLGVQVCRRHVPVVSVQRSPVISW